MTIQRDYILKEKELNLLNKILEDIEDFQSKSSFEFYDFVYAHYNFSLIKEFDDVKHCINTILKKERR